MKNFIIFTFLVLVIASCKPQLQGTGQQATNYDSTNYDQSSNLATSDVDMRCRQSDCPTVEVTATIEDGDTEDGVALNATEGQRNEWTIKAIANQDPTRRIKLFTVEKPSGLTEKYESNTDSELYTLEVKYTPSNSNSEVLKILMRDMYKCKQVVGDEDYDSVCNDEDKQSLGEYDTEREFYIVKQEDELAAYNKLKAEEEKQQKKQTTGALLGVADKLLTGGTFGGLLGILFQ